MNEDLKALITPSADIQTLRQAAIGQGMSSLRMAGLHKVKAGLTTLAEVLRVTPGDSVTNPFVVAG